MAVPRPATIFLLLLLTVTVKASYHFIRLVMLAAAGLAGMYMLHVLATDYNKIRQPAKPAAAAAAIAKLLFKRSVPDVAAISESLDMEMETLNEIPKLDDILHQDPRGCARKVVCELAAKPTSMLRLEEKNILNVLRETAGQDSYARKVFMQAMELGRRSRNLDICEEEFRKCPFSTQQIFKFLRNT